MATEPKSNSSREAILRAGLALLHEQGLSSGVTSIQLRRAAADAYLTTGAAYHVWDSQEDFHRDLAVAAVSWRDAGALDDTLPAVRAAVRAGAPWTEVVRLAAEANLHDPARDRGYLISLAVRASSRSDEAIRAAGARRHRAGVTEFAAFIENMMRLYRRRMRSPYTVIDLTVALNALSEGFSVHTLSAIEHPRYDIDGDSWTLFGAASVALASHFTEPDHSSSPT